MIFNKLDLKKIAYLVNENAVDYEFNRINDLIRKDAALGKLKSNGFVVRNFSVATFVAERFKELQFHVEMYYEGNENYKLLISWC